MVNSGTSAQTENCCFERHHGLKNKSDDGRARKHLQLKMWQTVDMTEGWRQRAEHSLFLIQTIPPQSHPEVSHTYSGRQTSKSNTLQIATQYKHVLEESVFSRQTSGDETLIVGRTTCSVSDTAEQYVWSPRSKLQTVCFCLYISFAGPMRSLLHLLP